MNARLNEATHATTVGSLAIWLLSFLAIPIAGYAGTFLVGRVDNPVSALIGGAFVGAVVGLVQALTSRRRLPVRVWTIATAVGLGAGVTAGTLAVGYGTSLAQLAVGGLITGALVGLAQAVALPARARLSWVAATAVLWPLAWTVTTLAGIKVDEQFIVFGASGASVYTLLAGLVLLALRLPSAYRPVMRADSAAAVATTSGPSAAAVPSGSSER